MVEARAVPLTGVKTPSCSWCGKLMVPGENMVRFPCPSCGRITIWRCEICRKLGRPYVCPVCGFKGP